MNWDIVLNMLNVSFVFETRFIVNSLAIHPKMLEDVNIFLVLLTKKFTF